MHGKLKFTTIAALALAGTLAVSGCTSKNDTNAPSSGGSGTAKIKVAFVPKIAGIPYFEAMNEGGKEAAAEMGNITVNTPACAAGTPCRPVIHSQTVHTLAASA